MEFYSIYEFICLPFGLSSAPRVFTKVMKPFVSAAHNRGIRLVICLDDIAIISSSRNLSSEGTAIIIQILKSLGFIVNKEKSMLVPSQKVESLGFVIGSVEITVSLPERKMNKLLQQATLMWEKTQYLVRDLAHAIGLIVSSFPAISPVRLYFRDLEFCILDAFSANDGDYNSFACLSEPAKTAFQWYVVLSRADNAD